MTDNLDNQTQEQETGGRGGSIESKGSAHLQEPAPDQASGRTGGNTQTKSGSNVNSDNSPSQPTTPGSGD